MALIILSWFYILFCAVGFGILGRMLFNLKSIGLFYTILIGMFTQMLLLHFYYLFFAGNARLYMISLAISFLAVVLKFKTIKNLFIQTFNYGRNWNLFTKFLTPVLVLGILANASNGVYLVDNESYYVQTIKWLNEYGLVKGLGNLHIFLAQISGWHILQSGLNFGFISDKLNSLNGFMMVICTVFFLNKFDNYLKYKKLKFLFLGLIPCANLFYFQFIKSPSPDIPVFLLTPMIIYLFVENYKNYKGHFRLMLLLSIFLVLVKVTIVPVLLLPFIILLKHQLLKKEFLWTGLIGVVSLSALGLRNYIISGYPFYPLGIFSNWVNVDWKVPESLIQFYFKYTNWSGFPQLQFNKFESYSWIEKSKAWIFTNDLDLIFNSLLLILLIVFPFYIKRKKEIILLYFIAVFNFIILLLTSPQYRFFFHLIMAMGCYIMAVTFVKKIKLNQIILGFLALLPIPTLFINYNISNNPYMADTFEALNFENLLIPEPNSRIKNNYEIIKQENLEFYSPLDKHTMLWMTGDGKLPCVNVKMLEFVKKKMNIYPQLRTHDLQDGFYAEKISE